MKTRIKYIKTDKNGWLYAVQIKKWIFWKTLETYTSIEGADRFLNTLKEIDDFNNKNSKPKSLKKTVYEGYGVRNIFKSGRPYSSLGFFTAYPRKKEGRDGGVDWLGPHGDVLSLLDIKLPKLFGKECLEPMKLRITIEQIEE